MRNPRPTSAVDQESLELVRRLGDALARHSQELETLFDLLPIGIAIATDRECRHVRVNRTLAERLGITNAAGRDSKQEPRPAELFNSRELPCGNVPMQHAARHVVEVRDVEVDIIDRDGWRVSFIESAFPLVDEKGAVYGALGVFVDMTDRRRVEQEQRFLADASRILASSLDYDSTVRTLARLAVPVLGNLCAIDVVTPDGTLERMELVVQDESMRWVIDRLRKYPPPARNHASPAAAVLRDGRPLVIQNCSDETLASLAVDEEHLMLLRALDARSWVIAPLRARGRTLGLLTVASYSRPGMYADEQVALVNEIAGRAALALDNALLYRHAQETNRLKEEFLATLSHELRTPLNALLGWAHILKSPAIDEQTRRRALESIERNAQAQAVLINDLLDVSRVVTGKLKLETRPVNLHAVVLAAVDAVKPAVRAREIDLVLSLSPITGELIGDADRLQQVVWNLLSNAVKFTPIQGRVELTVEEVAGAVQITVADNGNGIDPALLPYVFERFRQGDSSTTRAHGGLGLGLSIVRHLVDLHGGTVTAASDGAAAGSRFVVTLPVRQPGAGASSADMPRQTPSTRKVLRGIRVLGVDDDPDSRELLLLIAQSAGADVMAVSSAFAALEAIEAFAPDVIVADIAMPDMDGYQLMHAIATQTPLRPRAIALSAYTSPTDVRRAAEAGFAVHLGKPADYDRLVGAIAAVMGVPTEGA